MVVQQRWRKRCHPSIAMRQPWEHWFDRSWPESSVRQRRCSVIDRRSKEKPPWKGLSAVHDGFWRLNERKTSKTNIVDKHDERTESIYYRNSPPNSRVNDVTDPRTYRRGWDNSTFCLWISTESSTNRFRPERDLHGLRTSALRRPSSNGSDREFPCYRCLLFHQIIGMFLWREEIFMIRSRENPPKERLTSMMEMNSCCVAAFNNFARSSMSAKMVANVRPVSKKFFVPFSFIGERMKTMKRASWQFRPKLHGFFRRAMATWRFWMDGEVHMIANQDWS